MKKAILIQGEIDGSLYMTGKLLDEYKQTLSSEKEEHPAY